MTNWNIDPDFTKAWIARKTQARKWNDARDKAAKRIDRELAAQDRAWRVKQLESCKIAALARIELEETLPGC